MTALLNLNNVSMSYGFFKSHRDKENRVLEGITLQINSGDRLGLMGRNGAGKSTLLRVMAGIYSPSHGEVIRKPGIEIALLSLGLGFKDELSGRDNAYLAGVLRGYSKRDAKSRVKEIEEFAELGDFFDEPVKSYSSGMRSRLGFGAALLNDADILLVDETLSVGDAQFRMKAREALDERIKGNKAIVLVSHNNEQIKNICNRAVLIKDGRVAVDNDPAEVVKIYNEN